MEREDFLAYIAGLYYEENLTEAEIGHRVGLSRSTVSRLLRAAREAGIVKIIIDYPWRVSPELEQKLTERFQLTEAIVLKGQERPYPDVLKGLGILAARYIESVLTDGMVLGISWGTAVHSTILALKPKPYTGVKVVQMIGAVGTSDPQIDGPELARHLASVCNGEYRFLHAPLIVESPQVRDALLQEPHIRETLEMARQADLALVGIGSPRPEVSSLLRAGYLPREALTRLWEEGAVGDICARHYDIQGRFLDIPLNQRIVGIDPEGICRIKQVIGVAGGEAKAEAILGALRSGCLDVLVTDEAAARKVLQLDEMTR
ncbi:MAG: sugar-binding transcriptional regulator [Anaerolineae bacterium]|nr:sugar-binding transcriptional regulator [Anaerolineae bacterium]MDW8068287.1 sugar-binding transcriptional regulator [Anaerolineae bacterium]